MVDKELIKEIVQQTIAELKKSGMLRETTELAYSEISSLLKEYYEDGERDSVIKQALLNLENDTYYKVIPLYFSYGYTIESIAEVFDVEISTIVRNKKRLCLEVYNAIQ